MQVVDIERAKYMVREAARLAPGRPALRMGLRAALAVGAPMVAAAQIGALAMTWATLGGFGVVLVDKGGAYRTRAKAMTSATLGGALGALLGTYAASSPAVLAIIAVGTGLCAMAATWAGPAVAVGNTIAVQLIVATTLPQDPTRPWLPAVAFIAGGAWSLVLALLLWPVRVYRPARHAAMQCVQEIARHVEVIATRDDFDVGWREAVTRRHRAIREVLEAGRAVLAATRRGRRGEIGRGERLLVTVEMVDQIFGVLIGFEEVIDNLSLPARMAIAATLRAGLDAATARLDELAARLLVETKLAPLPPIAWTATPPAATLGPLARAEADHALLLVGRIHEDIAALAGVIDSLADEREPAVATRKKPPPAEAPADATRNKPPPAEARADATPVIAPRVDEIAAPQPWLEALRGSLNLDSAVLRHALRVATVALASVLITRALDLQRGYWASLTAVLLLQPYLPATITRGLQRVGGTIAGGLVATAIAAIVHDPLGIAIVAIAFAAISAAVLQLNYGLYALFLTPTFVLLAEVHARDTHLVHLRIVNTLLGAGLAVAGALLLWPSRETSRAADRLADALDAATGYLHEVFAAVTEHLPARSTAVIDARRRAGRALNNADLSLDRLVAEAPPAEVLEPHMTLATMTRRLAATLSAFGTARHVADPGEAAAVLQAIGRDAETVLHGAAVALREGTTPPVYQRHELQTAGLPPLMAARVGRIDLQLSIIAEAAARTASVLAERRL